MATVKILKVGHALVSGVRGENGGAPSKDSIWGVAQIDNSLVKFFGRRGGVMRFKTEPSAKMAEVLAMFDNKVAGKGMEYNYTELTGDKIEELVPDLANTVRKGFFKARSAGKVNTRSTASAKKTKPAKVKTA